MRWILPGLIALFLAGCSQTEDTAKNVENEHLKELSWLIGTWVDDEPDVDFKSQYEWSINNQFILNTFTSNENGAVFKGDQVIGWDPAKKAIHSWFFDSHGGVGDSDWTRNGEEWVAETVYTLADGRTASGVHVYKKIDDNTYTFSSHDRDIDGEIMPDIGPYKMVRKR